MTVGTDRDSGTRRRDAAKTRQLLLEVARRRFARDGYAAATVRDIADEAGVNVALINRYFDSKEGLFEACLGYAVEELARAAGDVPRTDIPAAIAQQAAGTTPEGGPNQVLLLLLRSSGDERTEQMRLGVLRRFAERLAATAGWQPDRPDDGQLMLRAQLVLSAAIGVTLLRASGLQPLTYAGERDLVEPLRDLVNGVLRATRPE
ncbi:helix-turn-helix domain-containing protein [Catellatospora sp. KI3]|uniref:TetR/AcrR family transcriptional regulator n=1 Tax=Catellatospora sp. KI3 TaxID=3041620 RepID=UPI0024827912|nr:TetR/AcrR family transcriptional regulator [Catellatospora sp. KI3]MDI1462612.1 helix-turn-helix domain-containing protein [Catellatospora sp. KI3]